MTPNSYGLMFATPEGEPIDPRREWDLWREYLAEVGVQKNVRLHDVRHTTVDLLYEAGVDEDIITEIIGHSTRAMTRAYKARGNDTRTRGAMLQLSAHLAATPRP
jgi:integrase